MTGEAGAAALEACPGGLFGATWDKGIDLVAVERAASMREKCPVLTDEEVRRAVKVMTEREIGGRMIAGRLGIDARTVSRWREAMGVTS